MFDVEYNDGRYEYTDNSGQQRKYPTFEELDKCCKHCGEKIGEHNLVLGNLRKNIYICRTCAFRTSDKCRNTPSWPDIYLSIVFPVQERRPGGYSWIGNTLREIIPSQE